MTTKITILGGGAMATACAILLAERADQSVTIWARNRAYADEMQATRENRRLLPGVLLPPRVTVTADLDRALAGTQYLVAAIPTQFLRDSLSAIRSHLPQVVPVVSVAKGIENGTFLRPSEIITDTLEAPAVAALSGPSHAEEIGRGKPAIVVAASTDLAFSRLVQRMFNTERFRVYTN
ncbi:MAG: glycerol-3-phosphate dehydrogenase, partial [Planctomycetales bacterium 12-60-4]